MLYSFLKDFSKYPNLVICSRAVPARAVVSRSQTPFRRAHFARKDERRKGVWLRETTRAPPLTHVRAANSVYVRSHSEHGEGLACEATTYTIRTRVDNTTHIRLIASSRRAEGYSVTSTRAHARLGFITQFTASRMCYPANVTP